MSVTLFQDRENPTQKSLAIRGTDRLSDLLADGRIAAGEAAELNPQYVSLRGYFLQLISEGKLQGADALTVVGHSLGGFLAQALTAEFSTFVSQTYTYNAPGSGGIPAQVVEALVGTPLNLGVPGMFITNIVSQGGFSLPGDLGAAGLGTILGTPPVEIFIEVGWKSSEYSPQPLHTAGYGFTGSL